MKQTETPDDLELEAFERKLKHDQGVRLLRKWAEVHARRDEVIRAALRAGVSEREIERITGVARTTVARIVMKAKEG